MNELVNITLNGVQGQEVETRPVALVVSSHEGASMPDAARKLAGANPATPANLADIQPITTELIKPDEYDHKWKPCPTCGGDDYECKACDGNGHVRK